MNIDAAASLTHARNDSETLSAIKTLSLLDYTAIITLIPTQLLAIRPVQSLVFTIPYTLRDYRRAQTILDLFAAHISTLDMRGPAWIPEEYIPKLHAFNSLKSLYLYATHFTTIHASYQGRMLFQVPASLRQSAFPHSLEDLCIRIDPSNNYRPVFYDVLVSVLVNHEAVFPSLKRLKLSFIRSGYPSWDYWDHTHISRNESRKRYLCRMGSAYDASTGETVEHGVLQRTCAGLGVTLVTEAQTEIRDFE